MSRGLFLDPDELAGRSPAVVAAAEGLAAALRNLETVLGTEGRCWGGDEPGKAFEQTYDPDAEQTVANVRNLVGTLRSDGQSLVEIGDRFTTVDTYAGYRVLDHEARGTATVSIPAGPPNSSSTMVRPDVTSPRPGTDSAVPGGQPGSESSAGSAPAQHGSPPAPAGNTSGSGLSPAAGIPFGASEASPQVAAVGDEPSATGVAASRTEPATGDPPAGTTVAPAVSAPAPTTPTTPATTASAAETTGQVPSSPWSRPSLRPVPDAKAGPPPENPPGPRAPVRPQLPGAKQQRREREKDKRQQEEPVVVAAPANTETPPDVPGLPADRTPGSRRRTTPWSRTEPAEPTETSRADGSRIGH